MEMYSIFPLEHCYFIDKKLKIKKKFKVWYDLYN